MRRSVGSTVIGAAALLALAGCGSSEPAFHAHGEGEHGHGEGASAEHHASGAGGGAHEGAHEAAEASAGPRPTRVLADGSRLFGAELGEREPVALADITASPDRYAGQVVRTEGTIERVCQRMGCWMELRAESTPAVRVPMAGHAFFLPRDVAGRSATIEGRVAVQELSADARAHLESEGALATASALSIDATGVIVR